MHMQLFDNVTCTNRSYHPRTWETCYKNRGIQFCVTLNNLCQRFNLALSISYNFPRNIGYLFSCHSLLLIAITYYKEYILTLCGYPPIIHYEYLNNILL